MANFIATMQLNSLGPELNAGCTLQMLGMQMSAITLCVFGEMCT